MPDFCTHFDGYYLSRGLALHRSLVRTLGPGGFRLFVLCFDSVAEEALARLALPEVRPIALSRFEDGDGPLLAAKENRSRIEYYFTCTPSLPLFLLEREPEVAAITYLDADLWFLAHPQPIFDEIADRSIAIIEHRYPPRYAHLARRGRFNVGWLTFRNDERALACLRWWRARCLEWCYDRLEPTRFADQKYLDEWPARFPGVAVIRHEGANVAPWNLARYRLERRDGRLLVNEQELIFYHFQSLKLVTENIVDPDALRYGLHFSQRVARWLYAPYIRELRECARDVAAAPGSIRFANGAGGPAQAARRCASLGLGLLSRRYWVMPAPSPGPGPGPTT